MWRLGELCQVPSLCSCRRVCVYVCLSLSLSSCVHVRCLYLASLKPRTLRVRITPFVDTHARFRARAHRHTHTRRLRSHAHTHTDPPTHTYTHTYTRTRRFEEGSFCGTQLPSTQQAEEYVRAQSREGPSCSDNVGVDEDEDEERIATQAGESQYYGGVGWEYKEGDGGQIRRDGEGEHTLVREGGWCETGREGNESERTYTYGPVVEGAGEEGDSNRVTTDGLLGFGGVSERVSGIEGEEEGGFLDTQLPSTQEAERYLKRQAARR